MSIVKYLQRIERIDQLIRLNATGTPKELAERLGVGETVLYETLALMKQYGAPIYYDKGMQSYYYKEPCTFEFTFKKNKN